MMATVRYWVWGAAVLGALVLGTGLFTVDEREKALVTFLGQFEQNAQGQTKILGSGLHFAWPILNKVYFLNTQLQTLDVSQSAMVTQDQKNVIVDYYVKWRIRPDGYAAYFKATGGGFVSRADSLMARIAGDEVRAAMGSYSLSAVLKDERSSMMAHIQTLADQKGASLGIEVVDVRIKRIDLPKEVTETVFRQIRTQREQAAMEYRSKGRLTGNQIRAEADRQSAIYLAQAEKMARTLRGEGESEAARIREEAYRKNPAFYMFYQRMQAYKNTLNDPKQVLVLRPDSAFFKDFKGDHAARAE